MTVTDNNMGWKMSGRCGMKNTSVRRHIAMYIRVKRNKTTYFIQCDPTETTLSIKQKIQSLIDQPPSNQQLILLAKNNVSVILDDSKTLADQKVENDAVVALTLRKDDNEFEDVLISRPEDFMSSS
ncbi:hypothetical protein GUJ93_ZPchr0013g36337 [Zizania palustris]|uniref:Ubiquitin-like domain-containing protein n=1 Tax=Zizania palustris TaxID=103762 RepID=A0A8J5WUL4_ZIZPA|nr:hypothetical protein GUJ93_ZPchr0013g36337 [Zizania palustris]